MQQTKCLGDRFGTYLGRIVAIDVAVFHVRLHAVGQSKVHRAGRLAVLPVRAGRPGQRHRDVGPQQPPTPSAIAAAACALTTGPGGTVSSSCLTSLA